MTHAPASVRPRPARDRRNRLPVLYVHNSPFIGGGNRMLLTLFDQLGDTEFQPVAILPGPGPMEQELRRREIRYTILDLHAALERGALASLGMTAALAARMLGERVRLVHVNDPRYYRWASLAARWLGIARVCHLHLLPPPAELAWAFKTPPHVAITCSREMLGGLAGPRPALPPAALAALPNAVDLDAWTPPADLAALRRRLGLVPGGLVVTIVGLVSERKGHRYFLEMAQQVAALRDDTRFLVVGDDTEGQGRYRAAMEEHARALGIAPRVAFLGFRHDAPDWVAASDVVVLPSLREGLPLSLMEAHACGKPTVATDVDGIPEIVDDGVTGILVPPRDAAALGKAVATLLDDDHLRRRMGEAARHRAERLFGAKAYAAAMADAYRRALGAPCRPW